MLVEHTVQAPDLSSVPLHGVWVRIFGVAVEVVRLALPMALLLNRANRGQDLITRKYPHGADSSVFEEDPVVHLPKKVFTNRRLQVAKSSGVASPSVTYLDPLLRASRVVDSTLGIVSSD